VVIRAGDRVADVIAGDGRLIEVFIDAAPAFERLRNPAVRRIMGRLVTVEQAARIAGIDPTGLVERLNQGTRTVHPEPHVDMRESLPVMNSEPAGDRPAELVDVDPARVVELDVRPDLRAGEEPFSKIMAARKSLPDGCVLRLRAIFEPVPLYAVFRKQGFHHWTERLAADDWCVWFYRPTAPAPGTTPEEPEVTAEPAEGVVVLDVRGMEPPEPMLRTLKAL
jgi:hypothetical protein